MKKLSYLILALGLVVVLAAWAFSTSGDNIVSPNRELTTEEKAKLAKESARLANEGESAAELLSNTKLTAGEAPATIFPIDPQAITSRQAVLEDEDGRIADLRRMKEIKADGILSADERAEYEAIRQRETTWREPSQPPVILIDRSESEPNDSCNTADYMACGDRIFCADLDINAGDPADYFYFTLQDEYQVTLETHEPATGECPVDDPLGDSKLYLYDAGCVNELAFDDDGGQGLYSKIVIILTPGTYVAKVIPYSSFSSGHYHLTLDCIVPPTIWDCTDNPPDGKLPGGSESEPNDVCPTDADMAQCEYAYCGVIADVADVDWWYVDLPADTLLHSLHIRVFGDDTPNQYAYGLGLDPNVQLYYPDCNTMIAENEDYYGTFPDAELYDSQIDFGTYPCIPGGSRVWIKISTQYFAPGPYLLIINCEVCEECPPPANDSCSNAEYIPGPYPTTVYGTRVCATVDCANLGWDDVWYKFDAPYASNNIYIDYCPTGDSIDFDLTNGGIVLYNAPVDPPTQCPDDCAAYLSAATYGGFEFPRSCPDYPDTINSYAVWWNAMPGPATYYLPVWMDPGQFGFGFTIDVTEVLPCDVVCPPNAIDENEPDCGPDYVDTTNGGCNSTPEVFGSIAPGDTICGTSGTFLFQGSDYRDTDWFEFVNDTTRDFTFSAVGEFPMLIFIIDGTLGCPGLVILGQATGDDCDTVTLSIPGLGPGTYWMWVGPQVFTGWDCPKDYVAWFDAPPAVPTYCATCWTNQADDWITNVTFNTINNTTGMEPPPCSYGDYTGQSTTVLTGETHTLYVTFATTGWTECVTAWFDWNQDFDWNDPGERYDLGCGPDGTYSMPITIPSNATLGSTRLRVTEKWSSPADPCESGTYGETEDYTVIIGQGPVPEFTVVPDSVYGEAEPGSTDTEIISVSNTGETGSTLIFTASASINAPPIVSVVPGEPKVREIGLDSKIAEYAPYLSSYGSGPVITDFGDSVFWFDTQVPTGDDGCLGMEFDGTYFWVTGRNAAGGDIHKLHKFDDAGNWLISYDQGTASVWGWRDMAWDGTYLYASDSDTLVEIDPATGAPTGTGYPGPENPNRGLAYDPATDHFWTANFGSDIYEFDRTGAIINQYANSKAIYGLAWDDVSSGGPWLWVYSQDGAPLIQVSQFDPSLGVYTGVTFQGVLPAGYTDAIAGGAAFTTEWGTALTTGILFTMNQGTPTDFIMGYEIFQETWLSIDISGGSIPQGDPPIDITVTMDASVDISLDLPEGTYTGNINFTTNDPTNPNPTVPVVFQVGAAGPECCDYQAGDANGDGNVLGGDVTYSVRYFKGLGSPPPDTCWNDSTQTWQFSAGDANGTCTYTGADVTYLVAFFKAQNPCIDWCPQTPPCDFGPNDCPPPPGQTTIIVRPDTQPAKEIVR